MTATKELQAWLEQHRHLEDEDARERFYKNLLTTLEEKNGDGLREGLLALHKSVQATRVKAEKATQIKPTGSFQIFPKTYEEQQLLQSLLERMNIPFKMSA